MDCFHRDHMIKSSSTSSSSNIRFELISNEKRNSITSIIQKKLSYFLSIYKINPIATGHHSDLLKKQISSTTATVEVNSIAPSTSSVSSPSVGRPSKLVSNYFLFENKNIFSYYYQSFLDVKFTSLNVNTNNKHLYSNSKSGLYKVFSANNKQYQSTSISVHNGPSTNQERYLSYLNYYYLNTYQQNIIYLNNLILAIIILFVLFSVLILLEENDSFYNLSAITYLLLITFNLIIIIFSHNLAKQLLVYNRSFLY